jgi:hypothetical protein
MIFPPRTMSEALAEIARLEAEVAALRQELCPPEAYHRTSDLMLALDLTWLQARLLEVLMRRTSANRVQLEKAVWDSPVQGNCVSVLIRMLRVRLEKRSLRLEMQRSRGYFLTPDMKRKIQEILDGWIAAGRPDDRSSHIRLGHYGKKDATVQAEG